MINCHFIECNIILKYNNGSKLNNANHTHFIKFYTFSEQLYLYGR